MLTAVEGVYDNGQIILTEAPKFTHKVKVFVMFTEEVVNDQTTVESNLVPAHTLKGSLRGTWKNIDAKDKEEIHKHFDNIRNEWERDIWFRPRWSCLHRARRQQLAKYLKRFQVDLLLTQVRWKKFQQRREKKRFVLFGVVSKELGVSNELNI